jgi:beta-barrel assembly-enhancing protease
MFRSVVVGCLLLVSTAIVSGANASFRTVVWEDNAGYAVQAFGGVYSVDPELTQMVDHVGRRLVAGAALDKPYQFIVLNNHEPILGTLPGGYVLVSWGSIQWVENEAQLAALLAHGLHHAVMERDDNKAPMLTAYIEEELPPLGKIPNYALGGSQIPLSRFRSQNFSRIDSRIDELQADHHAQNYMAAAGYHPAAVSQLQQKLLDFGEGEAGSVLWPHRSTQEQIDRSQEHVKRLEFRQPGRWTYGGSLDTIEARLAAASPAYQLLKKSEQGFLWRATRLINKAIAIEPREGKFLTRLGDIQMQRRKCAEAINYYQQALLLGDSRYRVYLGKGYCEGQLGRHDQALQDLTAASRLLPNAIAAEQTAVIQQKLGQAAEAKRALLQLMAVAGERNAWAAKRYVDLDLVSNPELYFVASSRVRDGEFITLITNQSGFPVAGIDVRFTATVEGELREEMISAGQLEVPGQVELRPGWQIDEGDEVKDVYVRVVHVTRP